MSRSIGGVLDTRALSALIGSALVDANRMVHFHTLDRGQQAAAIRRLAAAGYSDHAISSRRSWPSKSFGPCWPSGDNRRTERDGRTAVATAAALSGLPGPPPGAGSDGVRSPDSLPELHLAEERTFQDKADCRSGGDRMSLRAAINAKCRECVFDAKCKGGTWREQVAQCSARHCPLWPYRPAPKSGPFANPPRDPATVTPKWLAYSVGGAISPAPSVDRTGPTITVAAQTDRRAKLARSVRDVA
ncbi:MAG: hypothetical protein JWO52_2554 [Gammaproteobacteria bacterium]|nr:hypothetical protein [Gammaproteobacteria bacterium]